jgi:hypothetical protein
MRSNLLKRIGVSVVALTGIGIAASFITSRAQADQWDKMTLLTVDQPVQVSNTYLEPGTYMFKLANSDRHIVQIFTKDRSHLINTIFAIPSYRLELTDGSQFTFWETPPGTAKAVRTWYYPGDHFGQEFVYPTNLRQVAMVTTAPAPPAPEPAPQALEQAPPAEQPQAEIAQTAPVETAPEVEPEPQAEQAPVEIAQNTASAPPAPPPLDQSANTQPDQPQQALPQTASPYPLFGLGGLLALGLYVALRIKAVA